MSDRVTRKRLEYDLAIQRAIKKHRKLSADELIAAVIRDSAKAYHAYMMSPKPIKRKGKR